MPLTQKDILLYIKDHGGRAAAIDLLNSYRDSSQINEANALLKEALRRGHIRSHGNVELALSYVTITPAGEDWLADLLQHETLIEELRQQMDLDRAERLASEARAAKFQRARTLENRAWQAVLVLIGLLTLLVTVFLKS